MNQQQQQQPTTTTTTTTTTITAAAAASTLVTTTSSGGGSSLMPEAISAGNVGPNSSGGRQQQQLSGGVQLHNLRPTSIGQFPANSGMMSKLPAVAGSGALEQQQLGVAEHQQQQSALDMAQSAAARVTGSAAAAIAAARFKMLRSNTLAAAFGLPGSGSSGDQAPQSDHGGGFGAPVDMLAMRTKDERVVNTLSFGSASGGRNKLN